MKIKNLALALVAMGAANVAMAADSGLITITGEVVDNTCDVAATGGSGALTVPLTTVTASDFNGAANTTSATNATFNLDISGCAAGTNAAGGVKITLTPTVPTTANGHLTNEVAGGSNVAIRLEDVTNGGNVAFTASSAAAADVAVTLANTGPGTPETATNQFRASYISTATTTTAGAVSSTVTYDIVYN